MRIFKADLHIHSCLSPCADLDMSPKAIVNEALRKGLDIIAICDHNSAENIEAGIKVAEKKRILVIPGLEICSKEEVHVLALFEKKEHALMMQQVVYSNLKGTNRPEIFGDQVVVNEHDEVEEFNMRLLIGAIGLNVYEIEKEIHRLKGLCILAHINRASYSIISQLGFIPDDLSADAVEIYGNVGVELENMIKNYPVIYSSDAHFLKDIGKRYTRLLLHKPDFYEIYMAIKNRNGRAILR